MEGKVRNGKLVLKLIIAAVLAIIFVAVVLTIISGFEIKKVYDEMVEEELKVASEQLNSEMSSVWDGDWSYDGENLYKGEQNVMAEYEELMDEMRSATGIEYSLFYGKERVITTLRDSSGKKAVGYNISDTVYNNVVGKNSEYYSPKSSPSGISAK